MILAEEDPEAPPISAELTCFAIASGVTLCCVALFGRSLLYFLRSFFEPFADIFAQFVGFSLSFLSEELIFAGFAAVCTLI